MLCQDSEVDAEDLFGSEKDSDSEMATTQELPGKGDEEEPVASPNRMKIPMMSRLRRFPRERIPARDPVQTCDPSTGV